MGLSEDIKFIKEKLEQEPKKKEKKFKLPFGKKVSTAQKKKNYVTIMKINENGQVDFKKLPIEQQTLMEEGIPRLATADYVLHYKKNPMIILPSWSVKPYSPAEQVEKSLTDGSNTKGYPILMARMKSETVGAKQKMGGILKWLIGIGLAGIIAYAFITGG